MRPPATLVRLHANPIVDRRLQGRDLGEQGSSLLAALAPSPGEHVLASENSRALWVADEQRRSSQRTVIGPEGLGERRGAARPPMPRRPVPGAAANRRELARRAAGAHRWQAPPLRASFRLDDPNLHWPSYGHVRFRELAQDAKRRGYHVAMATVPLDAWMVHPGARDAFARHPDSLSLIIHGNNHVHRGLLDSGPARRAWRSPVRRSRARTRCSAARGCR